MAHVSDIVICLKANNMDEGVTANTILSAITPEYIPGLFTFSVIVILLDLEENGIHKLEVKFSDPNGENVVQLETDLPAVPSMVINSSLPKEYRGINIAMDWNNVNFKISGVYELKVYYDGNEVGTKQIYVKGKNEK